MQHVPPRTLIIGGASSASSSPPSSPAWAPRSHCSSRGGTLLRNSEAVASEMVTESLRRKGVDLRFHAQLSSLTRPVAGGTVSAIVGDETSTSMKSS